MYRHVQICTFSIKLELPENRTIEIPINWHSGSSSLRRPTFQRTAPASFSNPVKYQTQVNILATFSIKLELLEKWTIKFPINWHSGSSLLRRPTFQRTAPASFSNSVKYQTQVNILATFSIKLELLEKWTTKFPINWHSGSSLLRRPTFQMTEPLCQFIGNFIVQFVDY